MMRFGEKIYKNDTSILTAVISCFNSCKFSEKLKILKMMWFGKKIEKNYTTFFNSCQFPKHEKCLK